jgi:hypothetical protein
VTSVLAERRERAQRERDQRSRRDTLRPAGARGG